MNQRHVHFIGIGGIGVSGIAQLAHKKGDKVSGSDIKESALTRKLASLGISVSIGHKAGHVEGAELVVYSSAIRPDNPELAAARGQGISVKRRAEFLSELMRDKKVVTITGAHGKTTTSSLCAKLLRTAGLHPTVAVGGILREDGENIRFGESEYFIAEADESDGTFLCYEPTYSIITNIDHEHMDFYKTYDKLLESFCAFVEKTKKEGCVIYCYEDAPLRKIVKKSTARGVSFGFSKEADFTAQKVLLGVGVSSFSCMRHERNLGAVRLSLMGRHNILNALAVIALGHELKVDFSVIKKALGEFEGVERRFQIKYEGDIFIVDDYAHHPTEIAATIEAARIMPASRLVVVFQPHRYSRTQALLAKFATCFAKVDYLVITDIYAAGEEPLDNVSAENIVSEVKKKAQAHAEYVAKELLIDHLRKIAQKGDLVLFLGAGDITRVSDEFAKVFQKQA
jgi:UDP-N-acetylmuramate--alanine ligase